MSDATDNRSFGSVLTAINEFHKRTDYILDKIFFLIPIRLAY